MSYLPFRKTGQGVPVSGEVKHYTCEAKGKPTSPQPSGEGRGVLACSHWCGYPKPVDLGLGRLKPLEREVEDRTGADVQIARMTWA